MTASSRRRTLADLALLLGTSLGVLALLGVTVLRLTDGRERAEQLHGQVERKLTSLRARSGEDGPVVADRGRLEAWASRADDRAAHLEWIAEVAAEEDVTLLSLRDADEPATEETPVRAVGHRVRASGDHRCVAAFLDGLQAAEGVAAVEDVRLSAEGAPTAGHVLVELSLRWFAIGEPVAALEVGAQEVLKR